jgi:NAD-dependent DNA ligase
MKKNKSLKVVYAVSPLVRKNTKIGDLFEKYQFDVKSMSREDAYNDDELSYFVKHIFTDKKNTKHTSKI